MDSNVQLYLGIGMLCRVYLSVWIVMYSIPECTDSYVQYQNDAVQEDQRYDY